MRVKVLSVMLFMSLAVEGFATHARAEEFIIYNGLPCGEFCQRWMGIRPEHDAEKARGPEAPPAVAAEESRPSRRKPSASARSQTIIGALIHASAPRPAKTDPSEETDSSIAPPRKVAASHRRKSDSHLAQDVEERHPRSSIKKSAARDDQTGKTVSGATTSEPRVEANPHDSSPPQVHAIETAPSQPIAPPKPKDVIADKTDDASAPATVARVEKPMAQEKDDAAAKPAAPNVPDAGANSDLHMAPGTEGSLPLAEPKAEQKELDRQSGTVEPPHAGKSDDQTSSSKTAAPDGDQRVLILLTNSDIAAPSDLNHKLVVIAGLNSVSQDVVRSTLNAAGCDGANISRGSPGDIDQVIVGEASGAIIAVVPSDKADRFSHIAGLKVFKLQLQPN